MSIYLVITISILVIITLYKAIFIRSDTDLRKYLVLLSIEILIVTGVFYGFINLFQKVSTISSNFNVYITLIIALILLFQAINKIPASANIKQVAIIIRNYLALIITVSGFLYWHISNIQPKISPFEAWVISLDVVLAHIVITIPMLQWLYYMILNILGVSDFLLFAFQSRFKIYGVFHSSIYPTLSASISLGLVWLLLIKTADLQNTLFGRYNQLLGWEVSTSYRFSVLFEQLKMFFGNQALAIIFGFAAFAISLTLSFSSLLSSIKNIENEFKKTVGNS